MHHLSIIFLSFTLKKRKTLGRLYNFSRIFSHLSKSGGPLELITFCGLHMHHSILVWICALGSRGGLLLSHLTAQGLMATSQIICAV